MKAARWPLALWAVGIALALSVVLRTHYTADLSAFLPQAPDAAQRLLVAQLRDGASSRVVLVALQGEPAAVPALSRALAARLRADAHFRLVANGEGQGGDADQALLFAQRYLLSDAVNAERFSAGGLRAAIEESLAQLSSSAGLLLKDLLTRDPTGETLHLISGLAGEVQAAQAEGVWVTRDRRRALLLLQTQASGADTDGQAAALTALREHFAAVNASAASPAQLILSGPGVFSVQARDSIRDEATRLSLLGSACIVLVLLALYRSPRVVLLGLVPVASGALAGIAAVSLLWGSVHGLTLGFGITLIGEGVDYAIYYFLHANEASAQRRLWRTIGLGVLSSIAGFAALLFSGFPGLAQLGLFSIAGVLVAAAVTRWVLPPCLPAGFELQLSARLPQALAAALAFAPRLRGALLLLVVAALALLVQRHATLWTHDLAALNPVSRAAQAEDAALRAELGAPEAGVMVVVAAANEGAALDASVPVLERLRRLRDEGVIGGWSAAADYLPGPATQAARRASLPPAETLRANLHTALQGLPLRAESLAPFVDAVAAAREAPLLTRADLAATSFASALDALLVPHEAGSAALVMLRAPASGSLSSAHLASALAGTAGVVVDLKQASDALYAGYLAEARVLASFGLAAIVLLLALSLRSGVRLLRVLAPLLAAVLVVSAALSLCGVPLNLLHLVGLMLVVAVGSNYALFFAADATAKPAPRTLLALALANLTTLIGFGLLAFSSLPVLQAFGLTVGPGALCSLLFAAILAPRSAAELGT